MEKKKLKLSISGDSKKTISSIEKAKSKATGDAIVGALLLGLAVVAAGAGGNPNDKDYNASDVSVYLISVYLVSVYLISVYLISVNLISVYQIPVYLTSVYLTSVYVISLYLISL